jgi:hypothetical protein
MEDVKRTHMAPFVKQLPVLTIQISTNDTLHFDLVSQNRNSADLHCRMLSKLLGIVNWRASLKDNAVFLNQNSEPA